ncbi:Crossover junction endodeoxyribonuclease RuvC [Planctomycetes bacterium MalM25]|nr:Crossover junction endodeoxyribonuclease RuvC [Planctomycetes bacterium MalM25]
MRILGVDPGLNITGYGVVDASRDGVRLVEAGVVRGTKGASLAKRVGEIHAGIAEVVEALRPEAVAVEELYSHYERVKTSILMGHARGVIVLAAEQAGLPVSHYAATQIKRILTGAGRAPKDQMQLAIQRELSLAAPPDPPDVADALAIALTHWHLGCRLPALGVTTAGEAMDID